MNSIKYNTNLNLKSNKIVEVKIFNQSNKKDIQNNKEKKTLLPENKTPQINDLSSKNNFDKKKNSNALIKSQKKIKRRDNFIYEEKNQKFKEVHKSPSVSNENKKFAKQSEASLEPKGHDKSNFILLENYKVYLKSIIQKEASANYPRVSIRKREEGNVEIVFSLDNEGTITEVFIGDNTNASKRIIESLTKVLKNKIVRFEKNEILKKTNTFSIIIVYKLK